MICISLLRVTSDLYLRLFSKLNENVSCWVRQKNSKGAPRTSGYFDIMEFSATLVLPPHLFLPFQWLDPGIESCGLLRSCAPPRFTAGQAR